MRRLRDVAVGGLGAVIQLTVRQFRCENLACPAVTFAEQIPGLTSPHARFTPLLPGEFDAIGLALAGRAGTWLSAKLGIAMSRHTLLRRVRALPENTAAAGPQVLGVDDFALRKGHVYGTVLIDMATRRTVEVLADRSAAPLADWLTRHPGVQVTCRDRAGACAEGARLGAPDAVQVADRFHLRQNLGTFVERTVARHRRCLAEPADDPGLADAEGDSGYPDEPIEPSGLFAQRAREHHALVHPMLEQGHGIRAIARHLGWGRHTVQRYARAAAWQDMVKGPRRTRPSKLDPFKPYLDQRRERGRVKISILHREITVLGFTGHYSLVRDYLGPRRPDPLAPPPAPPSIRCVTGRLTRHPHSLDADERPRLKAVLARCPHLDTLTGHVTAFAGMMSNLDGHLLDDWICAVIQDDLPDLASVANGLLQDYDAVRAGLTLPFSSGAVEGHVNRIKILKRQMYGRANLDLLRQRVLHAG